MHPSGYSSAGLANVAFVAVHARDDVSSSPRFFICSFGVDASIVIVLEGLSVSMIPWDWRNLEVILDTPLMHDKVMILFD